MKCLVVEDEPQSLRYICRGLEEALYVVTPFNNCADTLEHNVETAWDLVVTDRLLPGEVTAPGGPLTR
jgi:two-component system, OmpR family, response regulator